MEESSNFIPSISFLDIFVPEVYPILVGIMCGSVDRMGVRLKQWNKFLLKFAKMSEVSRCFLVVKSVGVFSHGPRSHCSSGGDLGFLVVSIAGIFTRCAWWYRTPLTDRRLVSW